MSDDSDISLAPRKHLAERVASESEAYGYTLTVWGTGALLIHHFGSPGFGSIVAFVLGAVAGFALVVTVTASGLFQRIRSNNREYNRHRFAIATVHILSTLGAIGANAALIAVLGRWAPSWAILAVAGFVATVVYNTLLTLEVAASRLIYDRLENVEPGST